MSGMTVAAKSPVILTKYCLRFREPDARPAYHQYVICSPRREQLRTHLKERGIATAIHYSKLIPEQSPIRQLGYDLVNVPNAVRLSRQILSIPCYPELTDAKVDHIINVLREFHKSAKKY